MTYKEKIFFLLGNRKKGVIKFSIFYFISALLDLLSIGLIVPLITILLTKETISNFYFFNLDFFKISGDTLLAFLTILLILFISKSFITILIQKKLLKFCDEIQLEISQKLFTAFQSMDYKDFISANKSLYIDGIGKWPGHVAQRVIKLSISTIGEFIITFFMVSVMLYTNWKVTIGIFGIIILFTFLYDFIFKKNVTNKAKLSNYHSVGRTKVVEEALGNLKGTKIYNLEKMFLNLISNHIKKDLGVIRNVSVINLIPRHAFEILAFAIIFIVFFFTYKSGTDISTVFSQLSVFLIAGLRLKPFSEILTLGLIRIRTAKDSVDRIVHFFEKSKIKDQIFPEKKLSVNFEFEKLKISNLSFNYDQKEILKNINLEILKNSFIGITGRSGSGKSTIIDIITGFLKPTKGDLYVNDKILNFDNYYLREKIAYITQDPYVMDETLEKNITLETDNINIDMKKIEDIINLLNIQDLKKRLMNDSETIKNQIMYRKVSISGGEKQLIAIARALYFDREILILDEATNALDQENMKRVFVYLEKLKNNKTIIIISHQKDVLKYCDKVYNLENKTISELIN